MYAYIKPGGKTSVNQKNYTAKKEKKKAQKEDSLTLISFEIGIKNHCHEPELRLGRYKQKCAYIDLI
jgi:hypothetical protein